MKRPFSIASVGLLPFAVGCMSGSYTTKRDVTTKGAGIGGVEAGRITAIGHGEDHPVADNSSAEGRRLNRRVSILLKAKAR